MSKPIVHAQNSVRKYGGSVEDYLPLHNFMDTSKGAHARVCHRAMFHHGLGPQIMEAIFGVTLINSSGMAVCVRDLAEDHILEDLGFIPSLDDWLRDLPVQPWMAGARKVKFQIVGEPTPEEEAVLQFVTPGADERPAPGHEIQEPRR